MRLRPVRVVGTSRSNSRQHCYGASSVAHIRPWMERENASSQHRPAMDRCPHFDLAASHSHTYPRFVGTRDIYQCAYYSSSGWRRASAAAVDQASGVKARPRRRLSWRICHISLFTQCITTRFHRARQHLVSALGHASRFRLDSDRPNSRHHSFLLVLNAKKSGTRSASPVDARSVGRPPRVLSRRNTLRRMRAQLSTHNTFFISVRDFQSYGSAPSGHL
jgi:hypothetical protein